MPARVTRSRLSAATRTDTAKTKEPKQLSSPPATPAPKRKGRSHVSATPKSTKSQSSGPATTEARPSSKKRARPSSKAEDESYELPHNLGAATANTPPGSAGRETGPSKKRARIKKEDELDESFKPDLTQIKTEDGTSPSKAGKLENKNLNKRSKGDWPWLTDPYPDWPHPTPEEAREVHRILTSIHGSREPPADIPKPSLMVAGCGQVKSILDALIRTLLSANTSRENAGRALQGLVARFGVLKEGIGKGSVDWNAVRLADVSEVKKAIHHGGMADRKSKYIKQMLDLVHAENQERAAQLRKDQDDPAGAGDEDEAARKAEIELADKNVLSLQHVYLLDDEDAFESLRRFEGIGVKTAACVLLFSLRRPAFAVDTHVYRLCRWLGWVPPQEWVKEQNAIAAEKHRTAGSSKKNGASPKKERFKGMPSVDRDPTFYHCDVKIPDELKYSLHALMIDHGRKCPRCRANTGEGSKGWSKGCKLEKLLSRDGSRKAGAVSAASAGSEEESEEDEWEGDDESD